jgi:deazaflavin-dependent oxidoreductase (nitroreductase family)
MDWLVGLIRRVGGYRWFAVLGRAYVPVDRWLGRLSRGRLVALGLPGLPSLLLTTTGRRTGAPRTTPLLYARDGDAFVVVGSNWGQAQHPAWSTNLLAHPDATVTVRGGQIPVRAHRVAGSERDRLWARLTELWPAYEEYLHRAGGRELRVFRLDRR